MSLSPEDRAKYAQILGNENALFSNPENNQSDTIRHQRSAPPVCPFCKEELPPESVFCQYCGKRIPCPESCRNTVPVFTSTETNSPVNRPERTPAVEQSKSHSHTERICRKCGGHINRKTKICDTCGKKYFTTRAGISIILLSFALIFVIASSSMQLLTQREIAAQKDEEIAGLNDTVSEQQDTLFILSDRVSMQQKQFDDQQDQIEKKSDKDESAEVAQSTSAPSGYTPKGYVWHEDPSDFTKGDYEATSTLSAENILPANENKPPFSAVGEVNTVPDDPEETEKTTEPTEVEESAPIEADEAAEWHTVSLISSQSQEYFRLSYAQIRKENGTYYFEFSYDIDVGGYFYIFPAGLNGGQFAQTMTKKEAGSGTILITSTEANIENNPQSTSRFLVGINRADAQDSDTRSLWSFTIPESVWGK